MWKGASWGVFGHLPRIPPQWSVLRMPQWEEALKCWRDNNSQLAWDGWILTCESSHKWPFSPQTPVWAKTELASWSWIERKKEEIISSSKFGFHETPKGLFIKRCCVLATQTSASKQIRFAFIYAHCVFGLCQLCHRVETNWSIFLKLQYINQSIAQIKEKMQTPLCLLRNPHLRNSSSSLLLSTQPS